MITRTRLQHFKTLVLALVVAGAVGPAAAAPPVVPDPPPRWHELTPRTTERRLTLVEEMAGHFWEWRGELVYVWDLAFVRRPDGMVVVSRAVLQLADGSIWSQPTDVAEQPRGSVEVRSLQDVFWNAGRTAWWSDLAGEVHAMSAAALEPGDVGLDGSVRVDPLDRCLLRGSFICVPTDECEEPICDAIGPGCLCGNKACDLVSIATCGGECSPGKGCRWDLLRGGCTCQP